MTKPKFCSNCGKQLPKEYEFPEDNPNPAVEMEDNDGNTVWDVYCHYCGWSGEVLSDVIIGGGEE